MLRLIRLVLLVTGCAGQPHRLTADQHDELARHYEATARSIETECWKHRRDELTVDAPTPCWKAEDLRFLEANRDAAAKHRVAAAEERAVSLNR